VFVLKKQLRSLNNDVEFVEKAEEDEEDVESKKGLCLSLMSIAGIHVFKEIASIIAHIVFNTMKELLRFSIIKKDFQN